jgi:hypothetical protein
MDTLDRLPGWTKTVVFEHTVWKWLPFLVLLGVLAGVGGLAIALAAQDSVNNLLGSLMIFMGQPYKAGQHIVVQGHDGFVEQIGLRCTKIRVLTGALTVIPNEKMANLDVENIGHRNFIRRQTSIRLDRTPHPNRAITPITRPCAMRCSTRSPVCGPPGRVR